MADWDASRILPEPARSKFIALSELARDKNAASRAAMEVVEDARTRRNNAQIALGLFLKKPVGHTDTEEARLRAAIADAEAEMKRVADSYQARSAKSGMVGQLASRLTSYLGDLPLSTKITLFTGSVPKRKGTPTEIVRANRQEAERLKQRIGEIRSAPFPAEEAIARVEAAISNLAAEGEPDVGGILIGESGIGWPTESHPHGVQALNLNNAIAVIAWMFRKELTAKLSRACVEAVEADGREPIPSASRPKLISAVHEQLLEAERIEEAAIEEAAKAGAEIERRADADPRAVLGLSSSLPPPHDDF